ncbi:MAG TPA: glycosyltransferase [Candidatus Limnocylindrales bacterium]
MTDRPDPIQAATLSRAMVLVWGPRNKGPRSAALARELGIADARFITAGSGKGLRSAVGRYPRQLASTVRALFDARPRGVLVQHPPSPVVWVVALYAALTGARYVIDAHSDAFQRGRWLRPLWLSRLLARRAQAVLVTDPHWARTVGRWGGVAIVNPDVPTAFETDESYPVGEGFSIAVVNTWATDEPIAAIVAAAHDLPGVTFHVTGRADARVTALGPLPPNVRFTDFLPEPAYYALLASASAVMCLTTRDHTMQRGACEALSLGRPIVTSDWPLLRDYFSQGTVHVDASSDGIREGVVRLRADYDRHLAAVLDLREVRRREWEDRRATLVYLLGGSSTQHSSDPAIAGSTGGSS